jgi:hypothetical protein
MNLAVSVDFRSKWTRCLNFATSQTAEVDQVSLLSSYCSGAEICSQNSVLHCVEICGQVLLYVAFPEGSRLILDQVMFTSSSIN